MYLTKQWGCYSFPCSSYTVKIIYFMTWFSSILQNEVKTHWSIIPRPLLISSVKRHFVWLFLVFQELLRFPDFQRHLLTVLQHRPGWSKEPWGEFCSIKLTWKTSKSQLVLLFQAEFLPLLLPLPVFLFHSYSLFKSQILSHICFTKHLFLQSENSPVVSLTGHNGWTSSKGL